VNNRLAHCNKRNLASVRHALVVRPKGGMGDDVSIRNNLLGELFEKLVRIITPLFGLAPLFGEKIYRGPKYERLVWRINIPRDN
jgi:hypothetical protein